MAVSELCKDQIRIRLIKDDPGLFLQINRTDDPDKSRENMMPCDPDVLCAVLRGLTYQLSSKDSYCVIRRTGEHVDLEFQRTDQKRRC